MRTVWCAALVVALAAGGCSSGRDHAGATTFRSRISTISVRTATPIDRALEDRTRFPATRFGEDDSPLALAGGQIVVDASTVSGRPLGLAVEDRDGRHRRLLPHHRGRQFGVGNVVSGGGFTVWLEWPDQDFSVQSWRIYALDNATGEIRLIDRATAPGAKAPPALPDFGRLVMAGRRLFWTKAVLVGQRYGLRLMSCNVAACRPRAIALGATYLSTTDRAVYWASSADLQGKPADQVFRVMRWDLSDAKPSRLATVRVSKHGGLDGLAVSEDHMVWTTFDDDANSSATIVDRRTGNRVVLEGISGVSLFQPTVTSSFALIPDGNGGGKIDAAGYLYSFRTSRLYRLGSSGRYLMAASGRTVVWFDSAAADAKQVDITTGRVR